MCSCRTGDGNILHFSKGKHRVSVWGVVRFSSILCWAAAAQNKMIRRDLKWDGIDLPKFCIIKGLRVGSPLQVCA